MKATKLKMRRFLVLRLCDDKALTIEAFDQVHALNLVILDQHGFIAAKNAEITYADDCMFAKGDGFLYGAKEV